MLHTVYPFLIIWLLNSGPIITVQYLDQSHIEIDIESNFQKASSIEFQTGEMITVQYQCSLENNILKMDFGIHGNTPTIPSGTVSSFHKIFWFLIGRAESGLIWLAKCENRKPLKEYEIEIEDYFKEFVQIGPNKLHAYSSQMFLINDNPFPYR